MYRWAYLLGAYFLDCLSSRRTLPLQLFTHASYTPITDYNLITKFPSYDNLFKMYVYKPYGVEYLA